MRLSVRVGEKDCCIYCKACDVLIERAKTKEDEKYYKAKKAFHKEDAWKRRECFQMLKDISRKSHDLPV